jgi:hypothetical protein
LLHSRAGRQPFAKVPTLQQEKEFATLASGAALAGFALSRIEDDAGMELLVATGGAITLSFQNRREVAAWLNGLLLSGRLGRWKPSHGA